MEPRASLADRLGGKGALTVAGLLAGTVLLQRWWLTGLLAVLLAGVAVAEVLRSRRERRRREEAGGTGPRSYTAQVHDGRDELVGPGRGWWAWAYTTHRLTLVVGPEALELVPTAFQRRRAHFHPGRLAWRDVTALRSWDVGRAVPGGTFSFLRVTLVALRLVDGSLVSFSTDAPELVADMVAHLEVEHGR
ncbi:hypothetical protein [Aquipuribacter sp. SD81]|uniref:hypothetical protein n=1 Tax=Aquipuribacter sp. SD81 TaxID=3127703 RepID=UPI0030169189